MNKKISYKLLLLTVLFSTFITLFITMLQLYIDYRNGITSIDKQFSLVLDSHTNSLTEGIWVFDDHQINLQVKGIVSLPDIIFASINLDDGNHYEYGKMQDKNIIERKIKLVYQDDTEEIYLGELYVIADVNRLYDELVNKIFIILFSQGIKTFVVSLFILYIFQILITRHIQKISSYTKEISFNKKDTPLKLNKTIFKNQPDELDCLVDSINNMQTEIYNSYVEIKSKDEMLQAQSRLAQMGEMISMIAHQWRQPLSVISMGANNILADIALDEIDKYTLEDTSKKILNMTQELSKTIDDFRNFYKPNKQATMIKLEDVIEKSLNIIKPSLINHNINIIQEHNSDKEIELYDNEVMHVILNIIKNAKDILEEKEIKDPYIKITTKDNRISIYDNGGGIPENIIGKIFDPYFSTKDGKNGTGLGLYMSKTIVEKHHSGKLSVENTDDGACFTIELGIIS